MLTSIDIENKYKLDFRYILDIPDHEKIYEILMATRLINDPLINSEFIEYLWGKGGEVNSNDVFFIKATFDNGESIDMGYTKAERTYSITTTSTGRLVRPQLINYLYANSHATTILNGARCDLTFEDDYYNRNNSRFLLDFINHYIKKYEPFSDKTLISNNQIMLDANPEFVIPIENTGSGYRKAVQILCWCYYLIYPEKGPLSDNNILLLDLPFEENLDRRLVWLLFDVIEELKINLVYYRSF